MLPRSSICSDLLSPSPSEQAGQNQVARWQVRFVHHKSACSSVTRLRLPSKRYTAPVKASSLTRKSSPPTSRSVVDLSSRCVLLREDSSAGSTASRTRAETIDLQTMSAVLTPNSSANNLSPWASFISFPADSPKPSTGSRTSSPRPTTLHNREINPFEDSFAPEKVAAARTEGDVRAIRPTRKRPTPAELEEEQKRKATRDAKRPKLRLGLNAPVSASSSADSAASSFSKTFSDHSRSKSTTISPDSSVAPSPASEPKVDTGSLINQLAVSAAMAGPAPFHYQPAPLPITLNAASSEIGQPFHSTMAPSSTYMPSTFQSSAPFAAFAPDNLIFDPYASLPPALLQPIALPELPVPPPLDLASPLLYDIGETPRPAPAGKKRGRKPKNAPTVSQAELEQERREALDRNRVAASRSRQRKKERVGNLETSEFPLHRFVGRPIRVAVPLSLLMLVG